jgi:DNA (cytosine-5)-methyltransferase 1
MLTYISLFSCAGVGCYGFKQQGFECVATNEIDKKRLEIQKHNQKCKYRTGYIDGDITLPKTKQLIFDEIAYWQEFESLDTVDVLIATPPCQGMSRANTSKVDVLPKNSLIVEAVVMISRINPKFFVFENVTAFTNTTCLDVDGIQKNIPEMIHSHLNKEYHFLIEKMNFQDFGSNSSRPRCIAIGIRKDLITKNQEFFVDQILKDLFPKKQKQTTIRQCAGYLESLNNAEFSNTDIYHYARNAPDRHLFWMEKVKEGQSAFDQEDLDRRPPLVNKMGGKFTRCFWDKSAKCILTRTDNFGSQHTVHPRDQRVFSIRELMCFQTIPKDFKWSDQEPKISDSLDKRKAYAKKTDCLIRICIGESVPTNIFNQIAKNIKEYLKCQN